VVTNVVGVPEPPIFVRPVYDVPAIDLLAAAPVSTNVPEAVSKSDHVVFCVLDVPPVLLHDSLIIPPALKKYLLAFSLEKVNVFDSVELLFQPDVDTLFTVLSEPLAVALFLLLNVVVMFVLSAVYAAIVLPALGCVIAVIDEP
jgi:hypothetical protein